MATNASSELPPSANDVSSNTWLVGEGESAQRIRSKNWSSTPIGPWQEWPVPLRTMVNLILASTIPMAVLWGPSLSLLHNDACRSLLGDRWDTALGSSVRELWPEVWSISEPDLLGVMTSGQSIYRENVCFPLNRQGRISNAYFTLAVLPISMESGCVDGLLVTFQETTAAVEHLQQLEKTKETLAASRSMLMAALASTPDAVFITDATGHIIEANDAFAAFYRFRNDGDSIQKFDDQMDRFDVRRPDGTVVPPDQWAVPRALRGESCTNVEYRHHRKDTGDTWIGSYNFAPMRDENSKIIGSVISCRDITEQKRAEEALRTSEAKYAAIFEKSPYALAIASPHGGIFTAVNDAFLRMFEYTREEVLGKTSAELHMADEESRQMALLALQQQGAVHGMECIRYTKSRRKVHVALSVNWVQLGDTPHVLITMEDLSARREADEAKRLYHESQQLADLKARFFANVSHEFRTPLALILGPAEQLVKSSELPMEIRPQLSTIARNAQTLLSYVNNLLDIAKIEEGHAAMTYETADIGEIVRLAASHFSVLANERHIDFIVEASGPCLVEVDPEKIRRVLLNLLSNAFKFSPRETRVRLSSREISGRIHIEVADSGVGIPEVERERVFNRFGTSNPGAMGLGLTIVREFVLLHHGTIAITQAPEGGALFSIELPARAPAGVHVAPLAAFKEAIDPTGEPSTIAHVPPNLRQTATGPLVLIIEDNPEMSAFIAANLDLNYRVAIAFNGREGLEKAQQIGPDLIICDLMMPVMDGEDFIVAARSSPNLKTTPIIILSALADDENRVRLLREGAQDYLIKPFSVDELRVRVNNLVARRVMEHALKAAEAKYRGIISVSAEAIIVIDEQHEIVEWNRGAEKIFGYSRQEMLGQSLNVLIPEESRANHEVRVDHFAHEKGSARKMSHSSPFGLRKSGERFPIAATISRIRLDHQLLMTAVVRDISEEKRHEDELRILADVGAILASLDYENTLHAVCRIAAHAFGGYALLYVLKDDTHLTAVAAASKDPEKAWCAAIVLENQDAHPSKHPVWEIIRNRQGMIMGVTREGINQYAKNPRHYEALCTINPQCTMGVPLLAGNQCRGALMVSTEMKQYDTRDLALAQEIGRRIALFIENARLHQSEQEAIRMRDEVLGIVAHDLRNPLGVILLEAAKLLRANDVDDRVTKAMASVDRCARRMHRIIEDLLDFVSFEAGQMSMDLNDESPAQLLADAADAQAPLFARAGLPLEIHLYPELPNISVDRHRILQVFQNLLGNALKFSSAGQKVIIGAKQGQEAILFWVQDHGRGIDADDLPRVFDRFWHGDARRGGGTGLGLAIVKQIIEIHGGRVWVESEVGQGSTFCFTIPLPRADALAG